MSGGKRKIYQRGHIALSSSKVYFLANQSDGSNGFGFEGSDEGSEEAFCSEGPFYIDSHDGSPIFFLANRNEEVFTS